MKSIGRRLRAALGLISIASSLVLLTAARDYQVRLEGEQVSSEHTFSFFFESSAVRTYVIEGSSDLVQWFSLTNLVGNAGPLWIQDAQASNMRQRFYRVGAALNVPMPTPVTNMVFINAGTFTMGSPDSESGRASNEGPQTVVTLSRGFWMGKYEVTQEDYAAVVGSVSPNHYGPKFPVDFESWDTATNYCQKLTEREVTAGHLPSGYIYRLPTEAEWEYACRAGTTTPFGVGDGASLSSTQANFDGGFPYGGAPMGPFRNSTTVGGTFPPNAWGLYDMHGNVWEWCQDIYGPYPGGTVSDPKGATSGTMHVLRGGGFTSTGSGCRTAKRDARSAVYRNFFQGFRIVLAQDP